MGAFVGDNSKQIRLEVLTSVTQQNSNAPIWNIKKIKNKI
jgi:hypothetical protein